MFAQHILFAKKQMPPAAAMSNKAKNLNVLYFTPGAGEVSKA